VTTGSVEPFKKLHARWGDAVQFLDVLVRQAHPGPGVEAYRTELQKLRDAEAYQQVEGIPWPVLVDDLNGRVHQRYGALADPSYLLDADGRVAFYLHWSNAPTLHQAIEALLAQDGRGTVLGGEQRVPHVGAAITEGWKGLRRGWPQSVIDMETALPGSAVVPWIGFQLRGLLAPLTLRAEPLPARTRAIAYSAVGALVGAMVARRVARG
jgi:hypothetical protein